jgi:hypothetical protein
MILFLQKDFKLCDKFYLNGFYDDSYVIISSIAREKTRDSIGMINSKHALISISVQDEMITKVLLKEICTKCTIIYYSQPNSLQYFTLDTLTLDLHASKSLNNTQQGCKERIYSTFEEHGREKANFVDLRVCLDKVTLPYNLDQPNGSEN